MDVFLLQDATLDSFSVVYAYEKLERDIPPSLFAPPPIAHNHSPGLSAYPSRHPFPAFSVLAKLSQAESCTGPVIIKTYSCYDANKANPVIREAFLQAFVEHPHNCPVFDLCMTWNKPKLRYFKLHIVVERLERDLLAESEQRRKANQRYSEEELLRVLKDVTEGLLHAKRMVRGRQTVAHRDVKPGHVFRARDGNCKVGDFGSAKKVLSEFLMSVAGTLKYISPEARRCLQTGSDGIDPFQSDVFSLGVTILHLAALKYPLEVEVMEDELVADCLQRQIAQLPYSAELKQLIERMVHIRPERRIRLETVNGEADALLTHPPLPLGAFPCQPVQSELPVDSQWAEDCSSDMIVLTSLLAL